MTSREVAKQIFSIDSIDEIRRIVGEFISRHKSTQDAAAINDLEKEIGQLHENKTSHELHVKSAVEKETQLNQEYTQLRQRIEMEKDTNREAEKDVFKIIARQNEIRGVLGNLKNEEDRLVMEESNFKREQQEAYVIVGREAVSNARFR